MHSLDPLDQIFSSFACCATCHNAEVVLSDLEAADGEDQGLVGGSNPQKSEELFQMKIVNCNVIKS